LFLLNSRIPHVSISSNLEVNENILHNWRQPSERFKVRPVERRCHPSTNLTIPPPDTFLRQNIFLPLEPTIFPKLQVYFADFPDLLYAIKTPEASNLEDLLR